MSASAALLKKGEKVMIHEWFMKAKVKLVQILDKLLQSCGTCTKKPIFYGHQVVLDHS
jgi:hypothetical protein